MPTVIYSHPLKRFLVPPEHSEPEGHGVCHMEMSQRQRRGLLSQCLTPIPPPSPATTYLPHVPERFEHGELSWLPGSTV